MTSKPHDAIFKAAFEHPEHAAAYLRGVLPAALVDAIAWPTMTRESGSFIDPDLADRHSDLLFSVKRWVRLAAWSRCACCCATSRSSPTMSN
jgi:hypothetical protein